MKPFSERVDYFVSAQDLIRLLFKPGPKRLIFRYQNSVRNVLSDSAYTLIIVLIAVFSRPLNVELYWILHNIDKETIDKYPRLTLIRRWILDRYCRAIFVTDPLFKDRFFRDSDRHHTITFGPKDNGSVSIENLAAISEARRRFDIVALCLGAKGEKYRHFDRLQYLTQLASEHGKSILFIVPRHVVHSGDNVLAIDEDNLDERQVAPYVDLVYRVNEDISMPYTVYAACEAQIPIVTSRDFFTYEIIQTYGIGFSEEEYFVAMQKDIDQVKKNMAKFMESRQWDSLAKAMRQ